MPTVSFVVDAMLLLLSEIKPETVLGGAVKAGRPVVFVASFRPPRAAKTFRRDRILVTTPVKHFILNSNVANQRG